MPLTYGLRYMGTLDGIVFFSHRLGSFLGVLMGGRHHDLYGSSETVWWVGVGALFVHLPIPERRKELAPAWPRRAGAATKRQSTGPL